MTATVITINGVEFTFDPALGNQSQQYVEFLSCLTAISNALGGGGGIQGTVAANNFPIGVDGTSIGTSSLVLDSGALKFNGNTLALNGGNGSQLATGNGSGSFKSTTDINVGSTNWAFVNNTPALTITDPLTNANTFSLLGCGFIVAAGSSTAPGQSGAVQIGYIKHLGPNQNFPVGLLAVSDAGVSLGNDTDPVTLSNQNFPLAAGTAGQLLATDGTNVVYTSNIPTQPALTAGTYNFGTCIVTVNASGVITNIAD